MQLNVHQVLEMTGGDGVNVVLEMLANVNLGEDLKVEPPYDRLGTKYSRNEL